MRIAILLIGLSLLIFSCKENTKELKPTENQNLFTELMVIHDEVMPMMSQVHRQKRNLLNLLDSLNSTNITKEDIDMSILQLQESDEKMMTWMADLDSNKQNENTTEATQYLKGQKKEISIIGKMIKTSIKSAKKIIENAKIQTK